jgi:hypothetical protein
MCPKIDVMERECKNLEFEVHLNGAWPAFSLALLPSSSGSWTGRLAHGERKPACIVTGWWLAQRSAGVDPPRAAATVAAHHRAARHWLFNAGGWGQPGVDWQETPSLPPVCSIPVLPLLLFTRRTCFPRPLIISAAAARLLWYFLSNETSIKYSATLCAGKRHSARSACLIIAAVVKISTRFRLIYVYSQRQQIFLGSHRAFFFMHVFAVRFQLV